MFISKKISVGTRASDLALAQTKIFINALSQSNFNKSIEHEIKTVKTSGDQTSSRLDKIGGKGLFIKELEEQIIEKKIDFGVHSMKDVPAHNNYEELEIICWMKRHFANDVLISNSGKGFFDLPSGSVIGTCSIRRRSQILHLRKDLKIRSIRGNVDTRINKLKDKKYDAIILSLAGIKRLGIEEIITEILDFKNFLPAACQGAIGIQSLKSNPLNNLLYKINDRKTEIECKAERNILYKLNANCNTPISVLAEINKSNIKIKIEIFDHDGSKIFKTELDDKIENYIRLGDEISIDVLNTVGKKKINELDKLKNDFDYTPSE